MGVEVSKTGVEWVDKQIKEELDNLQNSKFDKDISINYLKKLNKNSYKEMMSKNSGATIVAIQVLLKEAGYDVGKIDGILKNKGQTTSKTIEAVKAFQKKHGLNPDGTPRHLTVNKLLEQFESGGNVGGGNRTPQQPTSPEELEQTPEMITLEDIKKIDISKLGKFAPNGFIFNQGMEKSDNKGKYVELQVGGKKKRIYKRGNNKDGIFYQIVKGKSDSANYLIFANFKNGEREGREMFISSTGEKCVGECKNGKLEGQGTYTWPDGSKYVGQFKNGVSEGQGTLILPNGSKYVGQWSNSIFWSGTKYDKDGKTVLGKWKNGKKVQ